jgi:DNA-3-methyladenine glycosylase
MVARELLGKVLVRQTEETVLSGRIVEAEAYYGVNDPASHSFRGKTPRCALMWERPGLAYVYFTYGMHYLLNAVTEKVDTPGAVLLRALEPLTGVQAMQVNRGREHINELASGPAKLTEALSIRGEFNGHDLTKDAELFITAENAFSGFTIGQRGRIGVSHGADSQLRFYIVENPFVSKTISQHSLCQYRT